MKIKMSEIKCFYEQLEESGDLLSVFPQSKGSWSEDKKSFSKYYKENLEIESVFDKGTDNVKIRDFESEIDVEHYVL